MKRHDMQIAQKLGITILAVAGLCSGVTAAEVATLGTVEGETPPLPWHTANVWWSFAEADEPFESVSMDIHVDRDLPPECNLYVSPIGGCKLNEIGFYGGLQTNINGWPTREEVPRVHRGHGGIFSRWGKGTLSPHFARGTVNSLYESAGYEGDFVSVRRPVPWGKGVHTYSIRKLETEKEEGGVYTWFGCFVLNHQTGRTYYVGSLKFEGEQFRLTPNFAAFVEVYNTRVVTPGLVPEVNIGFGIPRINGRDVRLKGVKAIYPRSGASGSPDIARVVVEDNRPVVQLSAQRVEREEPGGHVLAIVQN